MVILSSRPLTNEVIHRFSFLLPASPWQVALVILFALLPKDAAISPKFHDFEQPHGSLQCRPTKFGNLSQSDALLCKAQGLSQSLAEQVMDVRSLVDSVDFSSLVDESSDDSTEESDSHQNLSPSPSPSPSQFTPSPSVHVHLEDHKKIGAGETSHLHPGIDPASLLENVDEEEEVENNGQGLWRSRHPVPHQERQDMLQWIFHQPRGQLAKAKALILKTKVSAQDVHSDVKNLEKTIRQVNFLLGNSVAHNQEAVEEIQEDSNILNMKIKRFETDTRHAKEDLKDHVANVKFLTKHSMITSKNAYDLAKANGRLSKEGMESTTKARMMSVRSSLLGNLAGKSARRASSTGARAIKTSRSADKSARLAMFKAARAYVRSSKANRRGKKMGQFAAKATSRSKYLAKQASKIEIENQVAKQRVNKEARKVASLANNLDKIHDKEKKLAAVIKVLEAQSILNKRVSEKLEGHQKVAQAITRKMQKNVESLKKNGRQIRRISYKLKDKQNSMENIQKQVDEMHETMEKELGITSDVTLGTHHQQVNMESLQDQMDKTLAATTALSSGLEKQEQRLLRQETKIDEHSKTMQTQTIKLDAFHQNLDKSAQKLDKVVKTNAEQDKAIAKNVATMKQHDEHLTVIAKEQFQMSRAMAANGMKKVVDSQGNIRLMQVKTKEEEDRLQDQLDESRERYKQASALNSGLAKNQKQLVMQAQNTGNKSAQTKAKNDKADKELKKIKDKEKDEQSSDFLLGFAALAVVILIGGYFFKQIQDTEKQVKAIKEAKEKELAEQEEEDGGGAWGDAGMFVGQ